MSQEQAYEVVLRDPQSVLQQCLGEDVQLRDFECEPLVKTGDNYGSTIVKLRAKISRGETGEEEELNLVAKMLPPTDFQRTIFESGFTFKKEIFLYEDLIPAYKRLLPAGDRFDVVPRFFGSRLSMKPGVHEVDEDAVILMENLKSKGYYMVDRHKGLDAAHIKAAITSLAKFHGIGLSIKQKKPAYLSSLKKFAVSMKSDVHIMNDYFAKVMQNLRKDPQAGQYVELITSIKSSNPNQNYYYWPLEPEHEWSCVVHGDFWSNNALFHRDEAGRADDVKIVDFQTFFVGSPLSDLVFLLCTSMESPLDRFDEALDTYRLMVVGVLEQLGCDAELFSEENFKQRLKIDARNELVHVLLMSKVVELRAGEELVNSPINEAGLRRMRRILEIYVEKNWI